MTDTTRILHLTDLHLLADAQTRLHGWDVERAFQTVLSHALEQHPDAAALVLGGDLVDDESEGGYRRLNARLERLRHPVLAMAGNHDDPERMARTLGAACVHGQICVGGWQLIALNSHVDGSDAGRLGHGAIIALNRELAAEQMPALIFVHHPPVPVGSTWIDAMRLADGAKLAAILARHPRVRGVVCGHAHQEASLSLGTIDCWITPATMRQFLPGSPTFSADPASAPGYRVIELGCDGTAKTRVRRVERAREAGG